MAIKDGPSDADYRQVVTNGGTARFVIEPHDIDSTRGFEKATLIAPHLDTGFMLEPSPSLFDPQNISTVAAYGGGWVGIIYAVYGRKGKITYKRLAPDLYEAICEVPTRV